MAEGKVIPIADQVAARVRQEAQASPPEKPPIDPGFVVQCFHSNEFGDGSLFAAIHRGEFVFNHSAQQWMRWVGHHWEIDEKQRACHGVEDVVQAYAENSAALYAAEIDAKALNKRMSRLRTMRGVNNCLYFAARCTLPLSIKGEEIDQRPWLLACRNGVVDLKTGDVLPGRPEDYLLKSCPVDWQGLECHAERFMAFLDQVYARDQELISFVLRLFGHALIGQVVENTIPFFYGPRGRNGKTVLFNVLSKVLGPLAGTINPEMLMEQKFAKSSSGPSPDIMALKGMRLLYGSEPEEKGRLSTARIKYLTGNEVLRGRNPNDKYEVEFTPSHSFFLLSNHLPDTGASGGDEAFWARLAVVFHGERFVDTPQAQNEHKAIKDLADVLLREESPGILAALVRGCMEYQRVGLAPPASVLAQTSDYRSSEDLIGAFLEEMCITEADAWVMAGELFEAFNDWFVGGGFGKRPMVQKTFGGLMNGRAERVKRSGLTFYQGIRLNEIALTEVREKMKKKAQDKRGGSGP